MAKAIAQATGKPLIGVNHLEGHIYSAWLYPANASPHQPPRFPIMALLVSGGHSELVLMKDHLQYQRLGGTLDDAAGEAFDKVARLLDLPYPGGPSIQKASTNGSDTAFAFPRAMLEGTWDFSFSGVKTAVLRAVEALQAEGRDLPVEDLAASFQAAVVDVLVEKTLMAAEEFKVSEIIVAGGVSANKRLREKMLTDSKLPVHIPPLSLCTDNAAMIAGAAYYHYIQEDFSPANFDVLPTWTLS
jgi:N6-L-threonylcarbamoyladenine synthase